MSGRETAWRIFARELNASSLEKRGTEEMSPSYVITPLGTMVNRVLLAGVLVEKENTGTEEEPMWRARIQDVNGNFFLNVGRFQPEAAAAMADLEAPSYVAVIGKIRTYSPEEGKVYISIRPERIVQIAKRWFSAEELRILLGMRDPSTFLQIWTRKEALVKRSGEGLKGLREANTASLAESLQLHSFWIGDTVSAVCAHRDADIEEPVCMDQELLALFASK